MQDSYDLRPIGRAHIIDGRHALVLLPEFGSALEGLAAFSHAIALWWAHEADSDERRATLVCERPYRASTEGFGVLATRSQARPNPIGLSVFGIASVDVDNATILTPFIDTLPGTPILDIKPYFAASDRVAGANHPAHFAHWPRSIEESASFDWSDEFSD